ncbi:unnamed protein product [Heligmosomoides polygyrus]|uniref:Uncharacterized protein n=1 Tax=Heligmosomoides polygyrus TaxID=6339 RepID=A0A183GGE2_HELPZ|nr:unnamed protein product [Heligmosomoides polygyrus]
MQISLFQEVLDEIQGKINQLETKQGNQNHSGNPSTSGKETATYRIPKKLCIFCNDQHWASNCTSFKTLSARRERAQKLGKCERCLYDADHLVTSCSTEALTLTAKKLTARQLWQGTIRRFVIINLRCKFLGQQSSYGRFLEIIVELFEERQIKDS